MSVYIVVFVLAAATSNLLLDGTVHIIIIIVSAKYVGRDFAKHISQSISGSSSVAMWCSIRSQAAGDPCIVRVPIDGIDGAGIQYGLLVQAFLCMQINIYILYNTF